MNLNPFHHLRKYRQQSQEIAQLKQFNSLVLNRNNELNQDLANERQALDQANAKIKNLENELNEIQSEFLILVNAKTLSRKEARAIKNHKTKPEQYPQEPLTPQPLNAMVELPVHQHNHKHGE